MKVLAWICFGIGMVLLIISGIVWGFSEYWYSVNVGQYLRLADDSSTVEKKLDYLKQYDEAVKAKVHRDNARYFFPQKRLTKSEQLKILDSLIKRLTDINKMSKTSFEYQTAMQQITGQEFDHVINEIDGIFEACYLRQGDLGYWLYFNWIIFTSLFLVAIIIGLNYSEYI